MIRDRVYSFISESISQRGIAPSMREIRDGVGLASISTVAWHLRVLEDRQRIHVYPGVARGIVLNKENSSE